MRDYLLPGNKEYMEGDTIPRPPGGGGGSGSEGAPDGDGQDDFRFALSREEFVDLFLEDLELPDLAKRKVVDAEALSWSRAGYSVSGSPANLALMRTVRNSLSRRIALKRPKANEIARLRDEIAANAAFAERARKGGADLEFVEFEGAEHNFDDPGKQKQANAANRAATEETMRRAEQLFAERLRR